MELSGGSPGPGDYDPKGDERNSDPRGSPAPPTADPRTRCGRFASRACGESRPKLRRIMGEERIPSLTAFRHNPPTLHLISSQTGCSPASIGPSFRASRNEAKTKPCTKSSNQQFGRVPSRTCPWLACSPPAHSEMTCRLADCFLRAQQHTVGADVMALEEASPGCDPRSCSRLRRDISSTLHFQNHLSADPQPLAELADGR